MHTFLSLTVDEFQLLVKNEQVVVVDTRTKEHFAESFIPGAIFIGAEKENFTEWAKKILNPGTAIALVAEPGHESEVAEKLSSAGFSVKGYLHGGMDAWKTKGNTVDMVIDIEPDEFAMDIPFDEKMVIIDVRTEEEYEASHVKKAINIPLQQLTDKAIISNFEEDENLYVYCGTGYRSLIASSLLKKENYHNIRNIVGGFSEIKKEDKIPLENIKNLNK